MESTAKPTRPSEDLGSPAPVAWHALWAGAWLCSAAAYAFGNISSNPVSLSLRLASLAMLSLAFFARYGRRLALKVLGISVTVGLVATLVLFLQAEPTPTSFRFLHAGTNFSLMFPLLFEALRSRGVERQVVRDAATPALGLLMLGGFVYFILESVAGVPRLTGEWIWLLGGTFWIVSAGVVARKYV